MQGRTQDVVEQVAVVLVGVKSVIDVDVGSESGVEVAEVKLSVEDEEHVVCFEVFRTSARGLHVGL